MLRHPSWSRVPMPPSEIRLPPGAAAALARGELIQAIKIVRETAGLGLKEAKDAVEAYAAHPDAGKRSTPALGMKAEAARLVFPQQAVDALSRGALIDAIKHMRQANPQLGLKEAKDAVDAIAKKRPHAAPVRQAVRRVPTVVEGDRGHGGWLWLVTALAAIAAWWWMAGRG
jgi:ribosomal protein L7/L12